MAFDIEKFTAANFNDRTEDVPVPRLKAFFKLKKGENPVWKIRGLTGLESASAKQAVADNKNMDAIIKAIGTTIQADKVAGIRELAGLASDAAPDDLVLRYSWLKSGSVDPVCDQALALKLATNFPEDFYLLTNKIMMLTGQGRLGE